VERCRPNICTSAPCAASRSPGIVASPPLILQSLANEFLFYTIDIRSDSNFMTILVQSPALTRRDSKLQALEFDKLNLKLGSGQSFGSIAMLKL